MDTDDFFCSEFQSYFKTSINYNQLETRITVKKLTSQVKLKSDSLEEKKRTAGVEKPNHIFLEDAQVIAYSSKWKGLFSDEEWCYMLEKRD